MKTSTKFFASFAAISFALVGPVQAQLVTYQTVQPNVSPASAGYSSALQAFDGTAITQGEVFTNVLAINKMTYNLFTTSTTSSTTELQATFGQWVTTSPTTGSFVGPTLNWSSIIIPPSDSWGLLSIVGSSTFPTYQLSFDIATANGGNYYATSASSTYALLVTQVTPGQLYYGIGKVSNSAFAYGTALEGNSDGDIYSLGPPKDYTFSQISIVPNGNIVPAPESSTVAAILGCVLVAGLVGFRLRQQRQLALAPAAAA